MRRRTLFLFALLTLVGCNRTTAKPPALPQTASATALPALFTDISAKAGINFTLGHGGRTPLTILETLGGGCALFDYDNDGWLDILLVGPNRLALYHNNHDGTFTDATASSGLRQQGEWQGVATGDYDNDGKPDLYISGYRCCALYHNEGGGKFREVTKEAGVESKLWGASACFVDVDNDGYLDLFVTNYVKFYTDRSNKFCLQGGLMSTCGPTNYDPEKPVLYHNNRNGTFTDETKKRGLANASGNALGVAIADYDDDGWIDLAVANDQQPGDLFHNKGKGYFENIGNLSGTAVDTTGNAHAGMGIDWTDYDNDGKLELIVTTYQHQVKSLYKQIGPGLFSDICYTANIGHATQNFVGFGVKFLDYDNDGLPDFMIANGHAVDNIARTDRTATYPQRPQLFHNVGNGRYEEITTAAGPAFQQPIVGRGLAVGDLDNDGRPDAVIMDIEGRALILHNDCKTSNHWLALKLQGVKSNRDGIGARLSVEAGGKKWEQVVSTTGSFLAASDARAHLGLGAATKADRITIHWPGAGRQTLTDIAADRFLTIVEGRGIAAPTEERHKP